MLWQKHKRARGKEGLEGSVEDNCCFMKNCQRKPDMVTMRKDLKDVRDNESNPCILHRVVRVPLRKGFANVKVCL